MIIMSFQMDRARHTSSSNFVWIASASENYRRDLVMKGDDCALRCLPKMCPYFRRTGSTYIRRNRVRSSVPDLRKGPVSRYGCGSSVAYFHLVDPK